MTCQRAVSGWEVGGLQGSLEEGCQEGCGGGLILRLRGGSELESKVSEVRHLCWTGVSVKEVEEMGIVCQKAVAEVDRIHRG